MVSKALIKLGQGALSADHQQESPKGMRGKHRTSTRKTEVNSEVTITDRRRTGGGEGNQPDSGTSIERFSVNPVRS